MGPNYRRKDPHCTGVDRDQLVHIPRCVPVPHDGHQCCACRRRHSDWLLHLRHHLQVWCGNCDLSDLVRQVEQGGSFASLKRSASQLVGSMLALLVEVPVTISIKLWKFGNSVESRFFSCSVPTWFDLAIIVGFRGGPFLCTTNL